MLLNSGRFIVPYDVGQCAMYRVQGVGPCGLALQCLIPTVATNLKNINKQGALKGTHKAYFTIAQTHALLLLFLCTLS
jgi:hypothetical protein